VLGVPSVVDQLQPKNGSTRSRLLTSVKFHLNLLFIVQQEERLEAIGTLVTANIHRFWYLMCNADDADIRVGHR
jgi:hypothetical protein